MDQEIDGLNEVSNECGNLFSSVGNEMVDVTKIKIEDETDYFDVPSSSDNNIVAFIDRRTTSHERILTIDGMITPLIEQVEIKHKAKIFHKVLRKLKLN